MKRILAALSISVGALPSDLSFVFFPDSATIAYAATFMTLEQAKQEAFPAATRYESFSNEDLKDRDDSRAWRVFNGDQLLGYFVFDAVIGKHLYIDYVVSFNANAQVKKIDVLEYRENYGHEVAQKEWLKNFTGKKSDQIDFGNTIPNISGATYSAKHITEGVYELARIIGDLHS